jgi:hypothetical protein
MKKKCLIAIALSMVLLMAGTIWASDVTLNSSLNNPGSSVNLGFTMDGHLNVITNGYTSQNPPGSGVTPGALGEINTFEASGTFTGIYNTSVGNYGILGTYVNANANGGTGAGLLMTDYQNFDAMSGNHHDGIEGYFTAYAGGTNAAMNLKSIGSMYVWSEATNPYSQPCLQGQEILKAVSTTQNGSPLANLSLGVSTDGTATMSNSNIWGWGTNDDGVATTHYAGGTRTVTATGNGTYLQSGSGANSLNFNGFSLPGGGSAGLTVNFVGGFSGTYSMNAN